MEEKEGQYGPYLSISINEAGLKELNSQPKSAKGYINLTAGRQKDNQSKFSVKPYVPKNTGNRDDGSDSTDSLPF
jgi:hypothetical protein